MKPLAFALLLFGSLAQAQSHRIPGNEHLRGAVDLDEPVSLVVVNSNGNVRIVETEGSRILFEAENATAHEARLHVEGAGRSRKFWIEYPKQRSSGGVFRGAVSANLALGGGHGEVARSFGVAIGNTATVHLTLFVPRTMLENLSVTTPDNDLEVIGHFAEGPRTPRRHVVLETDTGSITCEGMCALGRLRAESRSGTYVRLSRVMGTARVFTETATVEVSDSIGSFSIDGQASRVTVSNVIGDVRVDTDSGRVTVSRTEGHLEVATDSGDVKVAGQRGGGIEIRSERGDLDLKNPLAHYEDVTTELGTTRRTRKIPRRGTRGPAPAFVGACVEDLVRKIDEGW